VLATAGVALAATVVAANLSHREKRIGRRLKLLYPAADPDFARAMGVLLELAIVDGNRWRMRRPCSGHRCRRLKDEGRGFVDADATPLMVVAMVLVQKLYIEGVAADRSLIDRKRRASNAIHGTSFLLA
jgi:hypothetical protein